MIESAQPYHEPQAVTGIHGEQRSACAPEPSSAEILAAVESALRPLGLLERAVLTTEPQLHTRSTIYFVGDRGRRSDGCLFVVKRPNEGSTQEDLADALGAEQQFESQRRLVAHFAATAPALRVPTTIALLPEVGAFVMEYVRGRDITQHITWRALVDFERLLEPMRIAARFLGHLHSIDGTTTVLTDLRALAREPLQLADDVMSPLGLSFPDEVTQALEALPARSVPATVARLHGDFAPVNVIVDDAAHGAGIDAALDSVGIVELDLARFLAMFGTERRFLAARRSKRMHDLRRAAEDAFVETYYESGDCGAPLEIYRIEALGRRWVRRQATRERNRPFLSSGRARVVDAHFRTLLAESARRLRELT